MIQLGPLALRWYGFLIALGVLLGTLWATREARRRGLDEEKLLDMAVWLVLAGIVGARLVYVVMSPSAFFGPGGNPLDAFKVWQGGISIHCGILGIVIATWLYARVHKLNMWAYLDVLTPVGALGVIGRRVGNFMNGSDTTGRLTGWPVGFTWPEPGTATFGALGRFVFGDNLWAVTALLGADVFMIATGLIAAVVGEPYYIWYLVSSGAYVAIAYLLLIPYRPQAEANYPGKSGAFDRLGTVHLTLWTLYPPVWILSAEGLHLISGTTEAFSYTVLDVVAKVGFGLLALSTLRKLDRPNPHNRSGLQTPGAETAASTVA